MKRSRPSPATAGAKRIKPNPLIYNVAAERMRWKSGEEQRVSWSTQGDVPRVLIMIRQSGRFEDHFLSYGMTNTGSTLVTVPAGLTAGKYAVTVRSESNMDVEASSTVTIDDEHRERCRRYALCLIGAPIRLPYALVRKIAVAAAVDEELETK